MEGRKELVLATKQKNSLKDHELNSVSYFRKSPLKLIKAK